MNKIDYTIRLEKPEDHRETENLIREAFWNIYKPGCLEHFVLHCYRDRDDFVPELDFVMEKDGKIIGQIMGDNAATKAICKKNGWPDVFENAPESTLPYIDEDDRGKYMDMFREIDAGHDRLFHRKRAARGAALPVQLAAAHRQSQALPAG